MFQTMTCGFNDGIFTPHCVSEILAMIEYGGYGLSETYLALCQILTSNLKMLWHIVSIIIRL